MKRTLFAYLALVATVFATGPLPAPAQGPVPSVADFPLFKAMAAKRTESGVLVPGAGAAPLQGTATSYGQAVLAGLWFQLDGAAEYGPAKWGYRWMFRLREKGGAQAIEAIYLDTMGQKITYEGLHDAEANRVQLVAKTPDGGAVRTQFTLEGDGTILVESVTFDPQENPAVRYSATSAAAE